MQYILRAYNVDSESKPISELHGKLFHARASYGRIQIAVLYHPAAAIYNQSLKTTLKNDFQILRAASKG